MKSKLYIPILIIAALLLSILYGYIKLYDILYLKPLLRIIPIIASILFILGIYIAISKKGIRILLVSVIFIVMILVSSWICSISIKFQYEKVFLQGNELVESLYKYYYQNKHYPNKLIDLTPEYLGRTISVKTTWGQNEFYYITQDNGNTFILEFSPYYYDGHGWIHKEQ
jgi:hypothetical protein